SVGIHPVAVITPRAARNASAAARRDAILTSAPEGLDLCFASDKASLERLTRAYEPEIGLCTGYPWLLPPEVLSIPRFGVVNTHPSRLPRFRGPYPFAWAIRECDEDIWLTVHLMDAQFDTGPILAQVSRPMPSDTSMEGLGPTLGAISAEILPRALERALSADRGDPQTDEGTSYAGPFEADYATLDPSRARAELHRQVRAWAWMFASPVVGPIAEVDGRPVRVIEATLDDPGDASVPRLDAMDGPLWLTSVEPA
ncbi:MAG TPA: formyltransferase family protein, partial [Gaiellaceae bacterium]|nr:formyltransferase family protein [Gaiellaceae bacterium]